MALENNYQLRQSVVKYLEPKYQGMVPQRSSSPVDSVLSSDEDALSDFSDLSPQKYHVQSQLDQLQKIQEQQLEIMRLQQQHVEAPPPPPQQQQHAPPMKQNMRYPDYIDPRPKKTTVGHSNITPSYNKQVQVLNEAFRHAEPKIPLGMWITSSGQEITAHRNVSQNRMLGGYEAPTQINIAPDTFAAENSAVFHDSLFEEQFDTRERLVSTGFIVNSQTGEAVETFESEMPPPTHDYSIAPEQLQKSNPFLIWMNGGYDVNAPRRKKTEIEAEMPGMDSGPNVFGDALYEKARREEVANRINRELFHNQDGNLPTVATMGEHPINKIGFQDATPRVVHMPVTQRATTGDMRKYKVNKDVAFNPGQGDLEWMLPKPEFRGNDLTDNAKRAFGNVGESVLETQNGYLASLDPAAHAKVKRLGDGAVVNKNETNLYDLAVSSFVQAPGVVSEPARPVNTKRGGNQANAHTVVQPDIQGPHVFDARQVSRAKHNVDIAESNLRTGAVHSHVLGGMTVSEHRETRKLQPKESLVINFDGELVGTGGWTPSEHTETRKRQQGPSVGSADLSSMLPGGAPQVHAQHTETRKRQQGPSVVSTDFASVMPGGPQMHAQHTETRKRQMMANPNVNLDAGIILGADVRDASQVGHRIMPNVDLLETTRTHQGQLGGHMQQTGDRVHTQVKATHKRQMVATPAANIESMFEAVAATYAQGTRKAPQKSSIQYERLSNVQGDELFHADTAGMLAANTQTKARRNVDISESSNPLSIVSPTDVQGASVRGPEYIGKKTRKEDLVTKVYNGPAHAQNFEGDCLNSDTSGNRFRGKMLKKSGLVEAWDQMLGGGAMHQTSEGTGGGDRMILPESSFQRMAYHNAKSTRGTGLQGEYEERRRLSNTFSQGDILEAMAPRGVPEQIVKPIGPNSEKRKSPDEIREPFYAFMRYANKGDFFATQ
jgi:hypothetical protein